MDSQNFEQDAQAYIRDWPDPGRQPRLIDGDLSPSPSGFVDSFSNMNEIGLQRLMVRMKLLKQ